jgi:hypothetical protein
MKPREHRPSGIAGNPSAETAMTADGSAAASWSSVAGTALNGTPWLWAVLAALIAAAAMGMWPPHFTI